MRRLLARWGALTGRERVILAGLMAGLPLVAFCLRLRGLADTQRLLERHSGTARRRDADAADLRAARKLARLAAIAGRRGPVTGSCLRQALLVYFLLRRRSLDPVLKIGVRRQADGIEAHAWVEVQDMALGDAIDAYAPLQRRARLAAR